MNDERSAPPRREQPNILVLLVDEERYPPLYENQEDRAWRRQHLVAQELLRANALEFHSHYIGSAACCPSRATLMTGQYPSLHGVSQTNGIAKQSFDSDMYWLGPHTVPTLGNYFREAGYQTYYKGKWHVSFEDIRVPGTHRSVPSYNPLTGVPDKQEEQLYLHANPLEDFGFDEWIGPEPHGRNPRNSASSAGIGTSGRDVVYGAEAAALIEALDRESRMNTEAPPWLLVASFVNPHDITLYGSLTSQLPVFRFDVDPAVPDIPPPPTFNESLHTKPDCQASYRSVYPQALQPILDQSYYRRLYYQLQKNADQQVLRVLEALRRSCFYENTIVVYTSDHGDLLGSHGGLFQKWYCAYEEMLHVPLLIHHPGLFPEPAACTALTSHVDLLPTLLGLAQLDAEAIQQRLKQRFSEVRPFVGRDLSDYITDASHGPLADEPIYYMSDDDVTRGQHQISPIGVRYSSVVQPNHVETVIARLIGRDRIETWKYSRYWDNPQFWSQPGVQDLPPLQSAAPAVPGFNAAAAGSPLGVPSAPAAKTSPAAEQYELYLLTDDPLEARNLAYPANATGHTRRIQQVMAYLLEEQRRKKRLLPSNTGVQ